MIKISFFLMIKNLLLMYQILCTIEVVHDILKEKKGKRRLARVSYKQIVVERRLSFKPFDRKPKQCQTQTF